MTINPATLTDAELVSLLQEATQAVGQDIRFVYKPFPHQDVVHQSQAKVRAVFAGNQSGKSYMAAQDDVWLATGRHPYRQWWEPPVKIRVVADGFKEMVEGFLEPLYKSIIHPKYLVDGSWEKSYSRGDHLLTLVNGSEIQFMSFRQGEQGQGPQKFAAVQLHRVRFEEQGSKDIWDESMLRLARYNGDAMICYTPVRGKGSWYYDGIYEPWQRGERPDVECFTGWSTDDNLSIPREAIESTFAGMDAQTVRIRRHGEWIDLGGGVYPMFRRDVHFVPFDVERVKKCTPTVIIDPHPSKATAVLWCGVGADERMFAYREYRAKKTIAEICDDIRRLSNEYREDVRRFFIDPHWGWENTEIGKSYQQLFHDNGIPVQAASKEKWSGIEQMRELLVPSPTANRAMFEVMDTCERLAWEFEHYSFKEQTPAQASRDRLATDDVDDDLVTCARYFVQTNPRFQGKRPRLGAGPVLSEFDNWMVGR